MGIIRQHQKGPEPPASSAGAKKGGKAATPSVHPHQPGAPVAARVLDVSKREGIVDLSSAPQHLDAAAAAAATSKKPGKEASAAALPSSSARKAGKGQAAADAVVTASSAAPSVGQRVEAVVELVKPSPGYVVVSLPQHGGALAFAAITDFNQQVPMGQGYGQDMKLWQGYHIFAMVLMEQQNIPQPSKPPKPTQTTYQPNHPCRTPSRSCGSHSPARGSRTQWSLAFPRRPAADGCCSVCHSRSPGARVSLLHRHSREGLQGGGCRGRTSGRSSLALSRRYMAATWMSRCGLWADGGAWYECSASLPQLGDPA